MTHRIGFKAGEAVVLTMRFPKLWFEKLKELADAELAIKSTDPFEGRKRQRQLRGWGTLSGIVRRALAKRLHIDIESPEALFPPVPYWKDGQKKRPGARTKLEKATMEAERARILAEYGKDYYAENVPGVRDVHPPKRHTRPRLSELHARIRGVSEPCREPISTTVRESEADPKSYWEQTP
jgi:hypothetical protein